MITTDRIKLSTLKALSNVDELSDTIVLKGGNAIHLVYKINDRASYDLDFSIAEDMTNEEFYCICPKLQRHLSEEFDKLGYIVIDFHGEEKPKQSKKEIDFEIPTLGFYICFKIVDKKTYNEVDGNIEKLRIRSVSIDNASHKSFEIEISKKEYFDDSSSVMIEIPIDDNDTVKIKVYKIELIVAEKIRAICQQFPQHEFSRKKSRSKDFYDIFKILEKFRSEFNLELFHIIIKKSFNAKNVSLDLLNSFDDECRSQHSKSWDSVISTSTQDPGNFDIYFDYVKDFSEKISNELRKNHG
jgi:predicted nucleotidyltransferase component of viral defense system